MNGIYVLGLGGAKGVSEKDLEAAILKELGLTAEQAVDALAEKLGVKREQPKAEVASSIKSGDTVQTAEGPARAFVLKSTDQAALANAARILSGAFGGNGR